MTRPLLALALASALAASACSSTPAKPADAPGKDPSADATAPAEAPTAAADAPPPPAPGVVKRDNDSGSVPDDYQLTAFDCSELGKTYHDVSKADLMKPLSPKLTEKQRTATEANIEREVSKITAQWTDTCQSNLVGKSVDPKALKCALSAATVKAFDVCLNGADAGKPVAPKPKRK